MNCPLNIVCKACVLAGIIGFVWVSDGRAQESTVDSTDIKVGTINALRDISSTSTGIISKTHDLGLTIPKIDSSLFGSLWNTLRHTLPSSEISMGYDYGLVPGYDYNEKFPIQTFVSDGNLAVSPFKIPLSISYHYTSEKSSFGLNNYVHVAFDVNAYKSKIAERIERYKQKLSHLTDSLSQQKQTLLQKSYYMQMIQAQLEEKINFLKDSTESAALRKEAKMKDSVIQIGDSKRDTLLGGVSNKKDSLNATLSSSAESATALYTKYKEKLLDSLNLVKQLEEGLLDDYKECEEGLAKIKQTVEGLKTFPASIPPEISGVLPISNFLYYTQKLDLGLCYPAASKFLASNAPVRGINFEWNSEEYYMAVSAGKVENNLLFNSSTLQNTLQGTQNLFNFFDFNNLTSGRKIVSIKGGIGRKESTHFYVGLLSGWGLESYIASDSSLSQNSSLSSKEQNLVIEADAKWQIAKNHSIQLVYGKSAIRNGKVTSDNGSQNIFSQLWDPQNRSNALYGNYSGAFPKLRTTVLIEGRYVDPFFRSFGVGFMQPDHMRYKIQLDQLITRSLKVSVFYKREHDNVLEILDYTNVLQSAGLSLSGKLGRHVSFRGSYQPIFQHFSGASDSMTFSNKNDITTANLAYNQMIQKSQLVVNGVYSVYRLSDTSGHYYNFSNAGLFCTLDGKKFLHNVGVNYFNSDQPDSLALNAVIFEFETTCKIFDRLSLTGGVRYSVSESLNSSIGGLVMASYALTKFITVKIDAERMVLGDFYTNFNSEALQRFPYLISGRLTFNLN